MLLWAVAFTVLVYFGICVAWLVLLRIGPKKRYNIAAVGVFLVAAVWKMLSNDFIACKLWIN